MENPKLIDATPFAPIVVKSHYDFDWEFLKPICENLIDTTPRQVDIEEGDGKSSVYNSKTPHTMKEFEGFYNWLEPIIEHVIVNEWGYTPDLKYGPVQSWVNVHNKGAVTVEHNHGAGIMAITTYLNLPEGGGYIEYKDPLEYQKGFHHRKELDWKWKELKAQTGDVLMFPGWLLHRTQPSNSYEERWVLTTNIAIYGPKGSDKVKPKPKSTFYL